MIGPSRHIKSPRSKRTEPDLLVLSVMPRGAIRRVTPEQCCVRNLDTDHRLNLLCRLSPVKHQMPTCGRFVCWQVSLHAPDVLTDGRNIPTTASSHIDPVLETDRQPRLLEVKRAANPELWATSAFRQLERGACPWPGDVICLKSSVTHLDRITMLILAWVIWVLVQELGGLAVHHRTGSAFL